MKHHRDPSKLLSNILSKKVLYLVTFHCEDEVKILIYLAMQNMAKSAIPKKLMNYAQA